MKRIRAITSAVFLLILSAGCSNILTNIYNEDNSQKTGNDSIASPDQSDTSAVLDAGLVVIRATQKSANQIAAFEADTAEYDIAVSFESADDSVEFRCFPEDKWATVTWKAEQVATTEQVTDESSAVYTELDPPVSVSITPKADSTYATAILPYGKTKITATITADDPHFSTVYSVTIAKPIVYDDGTGGTVAQLRDLSFTPLVISADELPDGYIPEVEVYHDLAFDRSTDSYTATGTRYWVNEDVGDIQVNLDIPDGVTLVSMTYGETADDGYASLADGTISTVTARSVYEFESVGGEHDLCITTKDSAGIARTYTVTIKKPESSDTSLRKFGYEISDLTNIERAIRAVTASSIGEEITDDWGTYVKLLDTADRGITQEKDYGSIQLSADYVRDITKLTYYVKTFHKRASVQWAVADVQPAENDSAWTAYDSKDGMTVSCTATDTSKTEQSQTLWLKVTAENKTTVNYYSMTVTKPDAGNDVIETLYVLAENSRAGTTAQTVGAGAGNSFAEAAALSEATLLLDNDDTNIDTYTSALTFYVLTANKNAAVTYSVQDADGTDVASGQAATEGTYDGNTYKTFTVAGLDETAYDGTSTITLTVSGTDYVFTLKKPDDTNVKIDCIEYESTKHTTDFSIGTESSPIAADTDSITLTVVTQGKTATVSAAAETTERDNNYATGTFGTVTAEQDGTYPTDWTVTLGDSDNPIPQGTTELTLTVSNTGTTDTTQVVVTVYKECASESRLESISLTTQDDSEITWNSAYDKDTYRTFEYWDEEQNKFISGKYPQGTSATTYSVSHKSGKPLILSLTGLHSGQKATVFYYAGPGANPRYPQLATDQALPLSIQLRDTGETTEYQVRIVSADGLLRRQYNIQVTYTGTELASVSSEDTTVTASDDGAWACEVDATTDSVTFAVRTYSSAESISNSWTNSSASVTMTQDATDPTLWSVTVTGLASVFEYAESTTISLQTATTNDTSANGTYIISIAKSSD